MSSTLAFMFFGACIWQMISFGAEVFMAFRGKRKSTLPSKADYFAICDSCTMGGSHR